MRPTEAVQTSPCPHFDHQDQSLIGDSLYEAYEELAGAPSQLVGIARRLLDRRALRRGPRGAQGPRNFRIGPRDVDPTPSYRSLPLESDPPEHGFLRRLFIGLTGRRRVRGEVGLERRVVDDFAAIGGGDAVASTSEKLPVEEIALMAELSPGTGGRARELTAEMWKKIGSDPDAMVPLRTLLIGEVETRRGSEGTGFLDQLAEAEYEGRPLSKDELGTVLISTVVAGHETTMNASSNLMLELALDPQLQDRLRENPERISAAVDEALRHRAPVYVFFRTVIRDTELSGAGMKAGEKLAIRYESANRDPERFDRPAEFDIECDEGGHLSFGWGIHRCVGAPLAQAELRLLTAEVLSHGTLELSGPPIGGPLEGGHHVGWRSLPLRYRSADGS